MNYSLNHPTRVLFASVVMFSVAFPAFAFVDTNPPLIDPATGYSYPKTASPVVHTSATIKKNKTTVAVIKGKTKKTSKLAKKTKVTKVTKVSKAKKTTTKR